MMDHPQRVGGETLAAISTGLVQLHTRFYGKGPTKAKTHMADDMVVSVLWNGFTTVEETLIREGKGEAVERFRRTFQAAMETQFRDVVEGATGRRVLAYMSQVHVDPNIAIELFLLEPDAKPSRTPAVEGHGEESRA
jgi:uncharacterized protein YbcI